MKPIFSYNDVEITKVKCNRSKWDHKRKVNKAKNLT